MRTIISIFILIAICVVFCVPLEAQTAQPPFLYLLEGKGTPTGTIHVFSVNSSTGAISEVPGSPFNAGLAPNQLVVDPTGRFVYVTNQISQDVTGFSVNPSTGALTELPGSPYSIGAQPITSAAEPTGRFYYVFANSTINGVEAEFLYEYTIDSVTGVLTLTSTSPSTWEFGQGILITSISFNAAGNYAYLGQVGANAVGAPILVCAVDFGSGTLSQAGSVQPDTTGEAEQLAVSPNSNFLYSVNTSSSRANAFAIASGGGSLSEISGSPYSMPNFPFSLFVHPLGRFLYVANENQPYQSSLAPSQYDGSISVFAINPGTGALTQVPGSPFAAGINPLSVVVEPTGNFVYSVSTNYTGGGTGFAQIMGFSINAFTGALTPFPGNAFTDSATSQGAQLVVSHGPITTIDPVPMISSLSPPSTIATAVPFTLQVNGANFVPGSMVYFGGQVRSTTFVNSTQLDASILASDIDNDGTALVFVFNPLPGGGASTSVEFPVSALTPVISSISPSTAIAGGISFTLFVLGSNFISSSVINFNGAPIATSYSSPNVVLAEILQSQILAQGTASISVTSPSNGVPGGGTSNTVTLPIVPSIGPLSVLGISPTSATAGGPAFTLTVSGTGFVPGSQVTFNLNNMTTNYVNSTELTATIPASAIAIAGNPYVIVNNPDGTASVFITFTVSNPPPGSGTVTPPSLPAGSNALTLNVTGTGFTQGSIVLVNGGARATTFVSSTSLQATLLPSDLMQSGTLNITVTNPPPGGGTTPAIIFTVVGYTVTPPSSTPSVTAGQSASFPLTVSPTNGTFSNPVTFSVSTLPAGTTASFEPSATITPGSASQIVTLSIATTAHTSVSAHRFPRGAPPIILLIGFAAISFAMSMLALRTSSHGHRHGLVGQFLLSLLLLVAASWMSACGAVGAGYSTPQPNPATGTPAGTYSITVTATSGGVSRSATVTLTVM